MALADLTTQQRNTLKRIIRVVAAEQAHNNPEQIIFNQLFDALFDTNAQRVARVDNVVSMYRAIRQSERNAADADNVAKKATLDADLAEVDAILAAT